MVHRCCNDRYPDSHERFESSSGIARVESLSTVERGFELRHENRQKSRSACNRQATSNGIEGDIAVAAEGPAALTSSVGGVWHMKVVAASERNSAGPFARTLLSAHFTGLKLAREAFSIVS